MASSDNPNIFTSPAEAIEYMEKNTEYERHTIPKDTYDFPYIQWPHLITLTFLRHQLLPVSFLCYLLEALRHQWKYQYFHLVLHQQHLQTLLRKLYNLHHLIHRL